MLMLMKKSHILNLLISLYLSQVRCILIDLNWTVYFLSCCCSVELVRRKQKIDKHTSKALSHGGNPSITINAILFPLHVLLNMKQAAHGAL